MQILQRARMSTDKAADVDLIANPGIVARRIIDTVDVDLEPKPERRLDGDLSAEEVDAAGNRGCDRSAGLAQLAFGHVPTRIWHFLPVVWQPASQCESSGDHLLMSWEGLSALMPPVAFACCST